MGVGSSVSKSKVLSESESEKNEIDTDTRELEKEKSIYLVAEKVVVNKVKDTDKLRNKKDVIECPPGYPAPSAPTSRKRDVFYPDKFKEANERVNSVPAAALGEYSTLLKHLTADTRSDLEKIWSIYLWVVNQNFNDSTHGKHTAGDTPRGYMKWIHDGKGDVPSFFAILCRRADIKCVIIDGICKGGDYEVGLPEQYLDKMRDRWNAVYLDKNWRFVHPYWGSRGSANIKSYFFLTESDEFNTWCRPDDRQWQLLTTMVTMTEFTNFPYFTAEFFMMNMKVLSPKVGRVRSRNGRVFVEIATTRNFAKTVVVKYHLLGKRLLKPKPTMNGNAGETTQRGIITSRLHEIEDEGKERNDDLLTPTAFPDDLEKFVFMWRKDAHFMFDIRLPVSGSYIFSVEAGHVNADCTISTMVVITELKLYCFDNVHEEDIELFPDVPEIGWGVTPHCLVRGIRPISHVDGEVFVLPDADTVIRFELDHEYEFDIEMIGTNFSEDLQQYTSHNVHNNLLTIKVRIPGEGHYGLKIHAKGEDDVDLVNVCNYFLVFNKISSNIEKFPKRMIRERLKRCIESGTKHGLMEALDDFKIHSVPDRGEVKKAKDKIGFFDDRKALSDAIKRKNPNYLQKAIQDAKKSRFTAELEEDIKRAEIFLAKLNRMEGFLHPIAKLEYATLAEIRCYTWPPEVVRNVLTATYVLLGENYEYLQDWDYIQGLMARVGKDGLKNKVLNLDTDSVPINQVDLADIIIDPHKLDEAREASNGTAALYQWIKNICNEKRSQQTSANSSALSDAERKRARLTGRPNEKAKKGQNVLPKVGQYDQGKQGKSGQYDKGKLGETGQYNNVKSGSNAKAKEHNDTRAIRDTNISSQHRFPKTEKKTDNIIGMRIIDDKSSPKTKSPDSKRSTSQKSGSSKNVSPMPKSPVSENVSPSNKSPANKYVSPTQKSPINKSPANRSPNQKSPNQKPHVQPSPTQRFHVIKSPPQRSPPQRSPPIIPSDVPPHRCPLQRPPPDEFLSPRRLSPVSPSDQPTNDD